MAGTREDIAKLEERIESLSASLERCRKIAMAAKGAIGLGVALMGALFLGLVGSDVLWLLVGATLLLGGIVLGGSNATTARQFSEQIASAEQMRAQLIGEMELTLVPSPSRLLH